MGSNYYLQLVWVIVVLAVILALIVYLIRFLNKRNQQMFRHGTIRTLGGVGLGQNKSLQIMEIGGCVYLLGVGEDIQLIDKVSDLKRPKESLIPSNEMLLHNKEISHLSLPSSQNVSVKKNRRGKWN